MNTAQKPRGFFGIAVYHPKNTANVGTLWRTADIMGADFFATIGRRYQRQASDTRKSWRHVPLFEFGDFDAFFESLPREAKLIGVEMAAGSKLLDNFIHPERAVYLLGAEDHGLPPAIIKRCHEIVQLRGEMSLNVGVAGSLVAYHRTMARTA